MMGQPYNVEKASPEKEKLVETDLNYSI